MIQVHALMHLVNENRLRVLERKIYLDCFVMLLFCSAVWLDGARKIMLHHNVDLAILLLRQDAGRKHRVWVRIA